MRMRTESQKRQRGRTVGSLALLFCVGCGTLVGSPEDSDFDGETKVREAKGASLSLALTDDVGAEDVALVVRFASLAISTDGNEWRDVSIVRSTTVDARAISAAGVSLFARQDELPEGDYRFTRLTLASDDAPKVVDAEGKTFTVEVDEAARDGIKLERAFHLTKGDSHELVIHLNTKESLTKLAGTDGYRWAPNLAFDDQPKEVKAGRIEGSMNAGATTACLYEASAAFDSASDCPGAVARAPILGGKFSFSFVPAGDYKVRAYRRNGKTADSAVVTVEDSGTATVLFAR